MTRKEEILSQAKLITGLFSFRNGLQTPEDAYVSGAEWADNNPINPWRKTSEELPEVDKDRKCIKVFARRGDDVLFVAFYSPIVGFSISSSFYREYELFNITHWMPIPELPKED